jgi:uncharacterized lipoprotein YddW (UPF0748 family)
MNCSWPLAWFCLMAACASTPRITAPVSRGIWVTRWNYLSANADGTRSVSRAQIHKVLRDCATAGFDTVFWQARGNGTVFYRSPLEPWAEELGFQDPGLDPLQVACEEAKALGIRLHAWVNVMPGWRGNTAPESPAQLYNSRPEWFLVNQRGERQPLRQGYYTALNPCLPEAAKTYLKRLEELTETPIWYVSVGTRRDQIIAVQ